MDWRIFKRVWRRSNFKIFTSSLTFSQWGKLSRDIMMTGFGGWISADRGIYTGGWLTSAGPSLLCRCMSRECGLPVSFRRPTPPAVLRWGLLQPGPLLPILRVKSDPASALLHLAVDLSLPDHVRLPIALNVCTWTHPCPSPPIFMKSCAPGTRSSPAVSVSGRSDPAIIRLGKPSRVHPKVRL